MTRRKNEHPADPGLDPDAMAAGAYLLLVVGTFVSGLTGSWVPLLGTIGAVAVTAWFANYKCRPK